MKIKSALLLLAVAALIIIASSLFADDKADVNRLLDDIEACYTSRDAAALSNTLSDYFVSVVDNPADPSDALILNKLQSLELLKKIFAAEKTESASQLMGLRKLHSKDPAGSKIPFNAKRGDKEVTLQSDPALLGIHMDSRLLPLENARLVNLQDDHPVKDVAKRLADAIRQRNIPAYLAETSLNGYIHFLPSDTGAEIKLVSRTNAAQMLPPFWDKVAVTIDYPSLEYLGCRAIAKENLAIVALEWKKKTTQGQTLQLPDIYISSPANRASGASFTTSSCREMISVSIFPRQTTRPPRPPLPCPPAQRCCAISMPAIRSPLHSS